MTKKQFTFFKLAVVITLSIAVALAVNYNIPYIPPLAIIISALTIQLLYRRVNEVTVDERDMKLGGEAAIMTLRIVSLALTILGGTLLAVSTTNPAYYKPGYLILYIVSFILMVNIFSYLFYQKKIDK